VSGLVGVVIPAGGAGLRLGGAPKQFRLLGGQPVLVQTVRAFARHPQIGPVVVAVPSAAIEATRQMLADAGVEAHVVVGGATRQSSVACGLAALPEAVETVLVHDAVRPFVSADLISRVVVAVEETGAAAAAVPIADTLRSAHDGRFGTTIPRDGVWAMQTPQGARRDVLVSAYGADVATDEVGLLERLGVPVAVVEGDTRNLKVTTPSDWALAEALWPVWIAETTAEASKATPGTAS